MRAFATWELALGAQVLSSMGITLTPDAIDRCGICETEYRRKNRLRHLQSRRHRKAFQRSWETSS